MKLITSQTLFLILLALFLAACNSQPSDSTQGEVAENPVIEVDATGGEESSDVAAGDDSEADETRETSESPHPASPEADGVSFAGQTPAPPFPAGLDWLNTSEPLTLSDLRGKVVLLDFWTYGCINCIHIIPELKALEEKYEAELVVIGVHSAKFENEGDTENIRRIVQRYELEHPVVNDRDFQIWTQYGARAWPTLVLIDPEGNVLGYHAGEAIYDRFDFIIGGMISEFDAIERIDRTPLETVLTQNRQVDSPLLFPGKVLVDDESDRLFIADSNHNRIVISDLNGNVLEVIGDGQARLQDGGYESASFFRPQGLALDSENNLYVADTENNAIRLVDLEDRLVTTAAGTGQHGFLQQSEIDGATSPLNSPWDVLYHDGLLYIAMAGQHQIWVMDPETRVVSVHAGSAREELKDGPLQQGGLNQPSGLATDGQLLYIADSEASAVRTADFDPDGHLETIVGTGLFDFGDVDGVGDAVRLQHPLDVAYFDGLLYVADTYNSKIKIVDPEAQESTTFLGGDQAGWRDGVNALFDEPGGISIGDDSLYIADTNNHTVRIANLATGEASTLVLVDMDGLLTRQPAGEEYSGSVVELDAQSVAPGSGTVTLDIDLPDGYKVNDLAPFSIAWFSEGDVLTVDEEQASRQIIEPDFPLTIPVEFDEGLGSLTGELVIYFCESESQSLCLIERVRITAPIMVAETGGSNLAIDYTVPAPPL